jgi:hypothetical protein
MWRWRCGCCGAAARRDGTVIGVRPVLSPGAVGYIVQSEPSDLILEPVAAAE